MNKFSGAVMVFSLALPLAGAGYMPAT